MANEVTKVELYGANNDGDPRSYIVASSAALAKGTVLDFGDGRIATASTGASDIFAGVACMEKKGDDYSVTVSAWTNGIFEFVAWGPVTAGDNVGTAAVANKVTSLTANTSSHAIVVGYALDTVASGARVAIRVNI